jgi:transglutaminase-like putative cysteine protease
MGGKSYLLPDTQHIVLALFVVLASLNQALADEPAYKIEPIPSWVIPVTAYAPSLSTVAESEHGYHDRLSDLQINGIERGNTHIFVAVEYSLTNSVGVENFSDIEISFDPNYQTLSLHELVIERDQVLKNRLDTASFDVIQFELDSASLFYDGTQTLRIELDDVQVGDTIRYSYTVAGENPVFGGFREFYVNTELWTQLDRQYVRILSASDDPMSRRIRGADVSLAVKDSLGIQETVFDQRGVTEFKTETGAPSWHEAQGTLVFSDMNSWQDVVEWAQPLFQLPDDATTEIIQIAEAIKQSHGSRDEQIGAVLRWVQEEINYISVELGTNSQQPSAPEATLARGFGDSKDKAVLSMAILRELDIEAYAALVNTQRGLEAGDYPFRLRAFNHVVVHVERNGDAHFIDPSRRSQSGALGELYEPNYGRALVIMPASVDLVAMDDSRSIVQQSVVKELTLPDEWSNLMRTSMKSSVDMAGHAAGLKVTSRKQGLLAEQVRDNLEKGGERLLNETYLDYYQVLFPSISAADSVELNDSEGNSSTFVENYTIEEFWNFNEKVGEHRWLYADEIIGSLDLPNKTENRKRSYELNHPISITETWLVPVSESVRMLLEEASVENEWVSFSKTASISEEDKQATITFAYATLANEVAARDLDRYVASVEQINDQASFYLHHAAELAAATPALSVPWNTAKIKFWVIFLSTIYFAGWSLHFMKRYRKTIDYYSDEDSAP